MKHKFAKCITKYVPAYNLLDYSLTFQTQGAASSFVLKIKRLFLILMLQILIVSILSSIDLIYHVLQNAVSQSTANVANGILKNAETGIPQQYFSNF